MAAANRITGQTAVVVGGSRGIGLGLVRKLLDRENRVIATARQPGGFSALHGLMCRV
jgi:NAD(P)-dependent dehydrogenase (short-subunit alcohol dehydrogenase family)